MEKDLFSYCSSVIQVRGYQYRHHLQPLTRNTQAKWLRKRRYTAESTGWRGFQSDSR